MLESVKQLETLVVGLCLTLWTLEVKAQGEVATESGSDPVTLDIVLASGGKAPRLLVNGSLMNHREVRMLLDVLGKNENHHVILRAPGETPFAVIVQVVQELRGKGIRNVDFAALERGVRSMEAVAEDAAPELSEKPGMPEIDEERVSRLVSQIIQTKDDSQRDLGLAELLEMAQEASTLREALEILVKVKDRPFERAPFLEICRAALGSESPELLAAAIAAAPTVGAGVEDVEAIARAVESEEAAVRKVVAQGLFGVDLAGKHQQTQPAIELLLQDEDPEVVHATIRSLWGMPLSMKAEELLIELSKTGSGEMAYDAVYYGLSTRPLVTHLVAERLIELVDAADGNVSRRVVWALSHHPATDEARPKIVSALIDTIDHTLNDYDRLGCIHGLGLHGGEAAVNKLKAIISNDLEGEKTREKAGRALKLLVPEDERKSSAEDAAASPAPAAQ